MKIHVRLDWSGWLTIALVALKLCGVIGWSWLWVLAPLWMPVAAVIVLGIILFIVAPDKLHEALEEMRERADAERKKTFD